MKDGLSETWQRRAGDLVRDTLLQTVPESWSVKERVNFFIGEIEEIRQEVSAYSSDVALGSSKCLGRAAPARIAMNSHEYVLKPLERSEALRSQAVALLANVCGVPTPPVSAVDIGGATSTATRLMTGSVALEHLQPCSQWSPTAVENLLASRCFNECVWNLDCWWGNFLVPEEGGISEIVNIDFDDAFTSRRPSWLKAALHRFYGIDRPIHDCGWSDAVLEFDRPLRFDPLRLDSPWTVYGKVWGGLIARLRDEPLLAERALATDGLTRDDLAGIFGSYLQYWWENGRGLVPVQAARAWLTRVEFVERLQSRLLAASEQFRFVISNAERHVQVNDEAY